MEFHISRNARDRYQVSDVLFSFVGNVIFADLGACRDFAYRMTAGDGSISRLGTQLLSPELRAF